MPAVDPAEAAAKHPVLTASLVLAVPMWIDRIRRERLTDEQRMARAAKCGEVIAHQGDAIQFKTKGTAEAFNRMAEGLALLAFQPGGVDFAGHHWEA